MFFSALKIVMDYIAAPPETREKWHRAAGMILRIALVPSILVAIGFGVHYRDQWMPEIAASNPPQLASSPTKQPAEKESHTIRFPPTAVHNDVAWEISATVAEKPEDAVAHLIVQSSNAPIPLSHWCIDSKKPAEAGFAPTAYVTVDPYSRTPTKHSAVPVSAVKWEKSRDPFRALKSPTAPRSTNPFTIPARQPEKNDAFNELQLAFVAGCRWTRKRGVGVV